MKSSWIRSPVVVFVFWALGACSDPLRNLEIHPTETLVCDDGLREARAAFVLTCLKNANPRSDEEPEDWMPLCSSMADRHYCKEMSSFYYCEMSVNGRHNRVGANVSCDKASTEEELFVCGRSAPPATKDGGS